MKPAMTEMSISNRINMKTRKKEKMTRRFQRTYRKRMKYGTISAKIWDNSMFKVFIIKSLSNYNLSNKNFLKTKKIRNNTKK